MSNVQYSPAAKGGEFYLFCKILANLIGVIHLPCLFKGDLCVGILHILHNGSVSPDFKVALVNVNDNVAVVCSTVHLGKLCTEDILQNAHHCRAVDIFVFFEFSKRAY